MPEKSQARLDLEARAEALGVEFAWNIGDDTLAARVDEAQAAADAEASDDGTPPQERKNDQPGEGAATGAGAPPEAPASPPAPTPPVTATGARIRVIGPKKGRWRAGRHFTAEGTDLNVDDLSDAEIAAIAADPRLKVVTYDEGE